MGGCSQTWAWNLNFNECINVAEFLHANLKVNLIIIGWAWSNMDVSFWVTGY